MSAVTPFIDTSILVRYLTGDPPQMAEQAAHLLEADREFQVTGVVLAETAYVLTTVYRVPREIVVDHLISLIHRRNITTHGLDKTIVISALLLCRPSHRISFADALIWASARSAGAAVVYSFDERFPAQGLEVRRP